MYCWMDWGKFRKLWNQCGLVDGTYVRTYDTWKRWVCSGLNSPALITSLFLSISFYQFAYGIEPITSFKSFSNLPFSYAFPLSFFSHLPLYSPCFGAWIVYQTEEKKVQEGDHFMLHAAGLALCLFAVDDTKGSILQDQKNQEEKRFLSNFGSRSLEIRISIWTKHTQPVFLANLSLGKKCSLSFRCNNAYTVYCSH